jgi:hypothetical protein
MNPKEEDTWEDMKKMKRFSFISATCQLGPIFRWTILKKFFTPNKNTIHGFSLYVGKFFMRLASKLEALGNFPQRTNKSSKTAYNEIPKNLIFPLQTGLHLTQFLFLDTKCTV